MSAYLAQLLSEAGVPVARSAFLKQQAPPYIVYVFSHSNNFLADSKVFLKRDNYPEPQLISISRSSSPSGNIDTTC